MNFGIQEWLGMNPRELLVLMLMCLAWGFHFVVIKLAVGEIPPIYYAAIRMTLVAVLLARFLKWRAGQMAPVFGAGLCLGALNYAFMFTGLKYAPASSAAIALELYVPFATIMSMIFLGDQLGWKRVIGIAFAFAGVAVIALGKDSAEIEDVRIGIGIGLVAAGAFTESIGAILVKKSPSLKPIELLAWFSVVGTAGLWLMTFMFETGQAEALGASNRWMIAGAIVYSAIVASIFGHSAYYWLLQRLPVSVVAPSVLLTTVLAVTFSVIFLGDPIGLNMVFGGIMTLGGVGIVLLRNVKKQGIKAPSIETEVAP